MKFNRDIFLTAPLWANWATVDRWGIFWCGSLSHNSVSAVNTGIPFTPQHSTFALVGW